MNQLGKIFEWKRERGEPSEALREARAAVADAGPTRGFLDALRGAEKRPALIAEVKKASPVKGLIREDFDAVAIAADYREAGAACLSVLTDEHFFQGSVENLVLARAESGLPVLRKDFTVSELDVWEARAMGADAILLIVYGLSDGELRGFRELAEGLGMDVIVEAHSEAECERALASGASILGINNRDLTSFETSVEVGLRLIPRYSGEVFVVSESALRSVEDVRRVAEAGASAVLIGTAFCSKPDVYEGVLEVMGWSGSRSAV